GRRRGRQPASPGGGPRATRQRAPDLPAPFTPSPTPLATYESGTIKVPGTGTLCEPAGERIRYPSGPPVNYCTAFIISKIGRYIAITMPPTITPRTTIIAGSIRLS